MPDPKTDNIIELTDVIEYGAGAAKPEKTAGGSDLSFERELEDLFAASSPNAASAQAPRAPEVDPAALKDLREHLEKRIDAVAARVDALPVPPAPIDEQALTDRIKHDILARLPKPEAIPAPPASENLPPKVEALAKDLRFEMEALKDHLAAMDPKELESRIASRVEERLRAFQAGLPPIPAPVDEKALAGRVRDGLATRSDLDGLRREIQEEIRKAVPAAAAHIIREEIQTLLKEVG